MAGGLNLYAYAANNPVLYNDPFGLSAITFFQGLGVGMAEGAGGALIIQAAMAFIMWAFPVAGGAMIAVGPGYSPTTGSKPSTTRSSPSGASGTTAPTSGTSASGG